MSRTTDDAIDHQVAMGEVDERDDSDQQFEHEANQACLALADDLTRAIDSWGYARVRRAIFDKGYELEVK